jgi:membrane associated rhomboid family serine protease
MARSGSSFFSIPHVAVYLILTANIAVFALSVNQAGVATIPTPILFRDGAMYWQALQTHQYWRLVAYGFLHANPIHLATNMLCLVLWGGHLERRVGPAYFIIIYFCAVVFGGLIGNYLHATPYLTVGASGATSGILGALLCLWILGKFDVVASFFVINIGLNVVLAMGNRGIDWGVHLGGLAAGLIACAILDLIEKANAFLLRCKFPEFVKVNLLMLVCAICLLVWASQPSLPDNGYGLLLLIAAVVACVVLIKAIDIALSLKRGLAAIALLFAVSNAAVVLVAGAAFAAPLACASQGQNLTPALNTVSQTICSNPTLVTALVAALALVLTLVLTSHDLSRGLRDIGFVGASLRGERKRRWGL